MGLTPKPEYAHGNQIHINFLSFFSYCNVLLKGKYGFFVGFFFFLLKAFITGFRTVFGGLLCFSHWNAFAS